jgi:hypothetical protein
LFADSLVEAFLKVDAPIRQVRRAAITRSALTKNRAEELGADVWLNFVIPRFFDRLDLNTARKPRLIIGGRGCGKTMLLRYLSHQSTFSPNRDLISVDAVKHIGLFWRADTQFASLMQKREIDSDVWESAFGHMAAVVLGIEILRSLDSISKSVCQAVNPSDLRKLDFSGLKAFDPDLPVTPKEFTEALTKRLWEFESWVSNVRTTAIPRFLPGYRFLLSLISLIRSQIDGLTDSTYFVYLDEYENLSPRQQMIVNTWLKHSEHPLIFNVAMKRHAFKVRQTLGNELLSDIHDYRTHDLESYLSEEFDLFAAEILFLNLSLDDVLESPVEEKLLRDPTRLPDRRGVEYKRRILTSARSLFPDLTHEDLARGVFADKALAQKLEERVATALRKRGSVLPSARFVRPNIPLASIVSPVLLHRPKLEPDEVAAELDKYEEGKPSRFDDAYGWTHNNFVGALLLLYGPHSRVCPFYAGFPTFCRLARGSLRHLLELCHKSIDQASADLGSIAWPIEPNQQAEAARQASTAFLGEVRSFGALGNQLYGFVHRIGTLFELAQQRPSQSESERNHFAITSGHVQLSEADWDFLNEASKWSVLVEEPGTKKKDESTPESSEYVLNPIYAPYFHISFRKKRRIDLSTEEVVVLMRGSADDVKALLGRYSKEWDVIPAEVVPDLFSTIEDAS